MAVTATPAFAQGASGSMGQVTAGQAGVRTAPTTSGSGWAQILTGTANGVRIEGVVFQAATTTVAGMVRVFRSDDNGTNWRLIAEIPTSSVTVSATLGGNQVVWRPEVTPYVITTNQLIGFTVEKSSETWNAIPVAGAL